MIDHPVHRLRSPVLLLGMAFLALVPHAAAASFAAAGKVDITPALDTNRVYLAGFGARGRTPTGVHDRLYARVLVVSDGKRTAAIVSLDLFGLYRNDVLDLRRMSKFDRAGRYLFVVATHQHSGPDTLGMWGPVPGVSGVDQGYLRRVKEDVAAKVLVLNDRLKPAVMKAAAGRIDPRGLCRDRRDPAVVDPDLGALSFSSRDGRPIATVVNWSCHAEVLGRDNTLVTADYPGYLCSEIEAKTGGACLFLPGSIGGLMTPDTGGAPGTFEEARRIGTRLADLALDGIKPAAGTKGFSVGFASSSFKVEIENSRYLVFLPWLAFGHELLDKEGRPLAPAKSPLGLSARHVLRRLKSGERPWIETEVGRLDIGPATILGVPGEIFPELVIGGFDGRFRWGQPLVDPANPEPPDLAHAPKGPYLKDLMRGRVNLVAGMANDEIGYIVPEYDFKIRDSLTLLPRLPGHHYEETNSIGRGATQAVLESCRRLLK